MWDQFVWFHFNAVPAALLVVNIYATYVASTLPIEPWKYLLAALAFGGLALYYASYWLLIQGPGSAREFKELKASSRQDEPPAIIRDSFYVDYEGRPRWCQEEKVWLPDRAYYVPAAKSSVLGFQFYLGNGIAVGLRNYKFFFQTLMYLLMSTFTVIMWSSMVDLFPLPIYLSFVAITSLVAIALGYVMSISDTMGDYHSKAYAKTGLRPCDYQKTHPPTAASLTGEQSQSGLDQAFYILGTNWSQWFLPVTATFPNGHNGSFYPRDKGLETAALIAETAELEKQAPPAPKPKKVWQ